MHKILLSIKKRLILITAIVLLFLSLFFAYRIFISMGYFSFNQQTLVGTIYIENVEESQYTSYISSEVNSWRNRSTYKINYQDFSLDIDLTYFTVNLDETISSINDGQSNKVIFNISDDSEVLLLNQFNDTFSESVLATFDFDGFLDTINNHLEVMNIFKSYDLEDFLNEEVSETVIDSYTISNIEPGDVTSILTSLTELIIDSDSRFSLLNKTDDLTLTNNQLSIIASGIQTITRDTPFNGYIFNQNSDFPTWSQEGLNVRVLQTNNHDFSFFNPSDFSYSVQISSDSQDSLTLKLIGYPFSNQYSVLKTQESILQYNTLYYDNELLGPATPNIIITDTDEETIYHLLVQAGVDGKILAFTRTTILPDDSTELDILYRETYNPTTEIFEENVVLKGGE